MRGLPRLTGVAAVYSSTLLASSSSFYLFFKGNVFFQSDFERSQPLVEAVRWGGAVRHLLGGKYELSFFFSLASEFFNFVAMRRASCA